MFQDDLHDDKAIVKIKGRSLGQIYAMPLIAFCLVSSLAISPPVAIFLVNTTSDDVVTRAWAERRVFFLITAASSTSEDRPSLLLSSAPPDY